MELLDGGVNRVHVRKPEWTAEEVKKLFGMIEPVFYPRLTLHGTPELIGSEPGQFPVGFQLNSRFPQAPEKAVMISKSSHSLAEAADAQRNPQIDYQTLSPIYDSISKKGYVSRFDAVGLSGLPHKTVALGGVTPDKFPELSKMGFHGAAMLGYVWNRLKDGDPVQAVLNSLSTQ